MQHHASRTLRYGYGVLGYDDLSKLLAEMDGETGTEQDAPRELTDQVFMRHGIDPAAIGRVAIEQGIVAYDADAHAKPVRGLATCFLMGCMLGLFAAEHQDNFRTQTPEPKES